MKLLRAERDKHQLGFANRDDIALFEECVLQKGLLIHKRDRRTVGIGPAKEGEAALIISDRCSETGHMGVIGNADLILRGTPDGVAIFEQFKGFPLACAFNDYEPAHDKLLFFFNRIQEDALLLG